MSILKSYSKTISIDFINISMGLNESEGSAGPPLFIEYEPKVPALFVSVPEFGLELPPPILKPPNLLYLGLTPAI
jgi:hypothetical protein